MWCEVWVGIKYVLSCSSKRGISSESSIRRHEVSQLPSKLLVCNDGVWRSILCGAVVPTNGVTTNQTEVCHTK